MRIDGDNIFFNRSEHFEHFERVYNGVRVFERNRQCFIVFKTLKSTTNNQRKNTLSLNVENKKSVKISVPDVLALFANFFFHQPPQRLNWSRLSVFLLELARACRKQGQRVRSNERRRLINRRRRINLFVLIASGNFFISQFRIYVLMQIQGRVALALVDCGFSVYICIKIRQN